MREASSTSKAPEQKKTKPRRGAFSGIQGRLIGLILLVLVPILIAQAYFFHDRYHYRKGVELQSNMEVARAVAKNFETFVQDIVHSELMIGLAISESQPITDQDRNRMLSRFEADHHAVRNISWVSPRGIVIASHSGLNIGLDISDRTYFREIVAGREWTVSELIAGMVSGKPGFTINRGIRNEQGELHGIVVASIDPERLDAVLGIDRLKEGDLNLVDNKGMMVYRYPQVEMAWEERDRLKKYPIYEEVFKGREVTNTYQVNWQPGNRISALTPISSIGWVAGAGATEKAVMRPVISASLKETGVFLLVALTSLLAALGLSRTISGSVKTLQEHALSLGRGETESLVIASGPAELKDLADAFKMMLEKVRSREKALRQSEQRYRELVQNANSAIIRFKSDGTITFFNEYAQTFFGYRDDEVIGKPINMILPEKESTGADLTTLIQDIVSHPEHFVNNINENIRRDGCRVWMAWTNKPIFDRNGGVDEVLAVGIDISDRKLMEEELRRSRTELELRVEERTAELAVSNAELQAYAGRLELLNVELQEFAFVASHDLQEPLRKIQSFATRLKSKCESSLGEDGCDYLSRMESAANRMSVLLSDLLNYSRVTTRANPFIPLDLSGVAELVTSDLEVLIEDTRALVKIDDLPVIEADESQMRQLLQNLISNALKYRREDEAPVVNVYSRAENGVCRLIVEDNGIGFDEKYLDRIFKPFQRLHGRTSQYDGTGMGLAICRKIVERHGGTITALSSPGKGSTFIATLPVKQASASALDENTPFLTSIHTA